MTENLADLPLFHCDHEPAVIEPNRNQGFVFPAKMLMAFVTEANFDTLPVLHAGRANMVKFRNKPERGFLMKNLQAGGFLFIGGAIIMTVTQFGKVVPIIGGVCALLGVGMLLYYLFSQDGQY